MIRKNIIRILFLSFIFMIVFIQTNASYSAGYSVNFDQSVVSGNSNNRYYSLTKNQTTGIKDNYFKIGNLGQYAGSNVYPSISVTLYLENTFIDTSFGTCNLGTCNSYTYQHMSDGLFQTPTKTSNKYYLEVTGGLRGVWKYGYGTLYQN